MKLFISCFFGLLFTAQAYAQLLIAPTRFVLDADTSVTEKIVVENNSNEPIRLEIKPIYRSVKASGLVRTDANIAESENIADWIKVSPPIIRELKPNQRRTVRLRMNALPDDMPDGEYRAYLWFSPIAKAPEATDLSRTVRSNNGSAFELNFHINSYVPVYVQKGEQVQDVKFQCADQSLKIINDGKFQFSAKLNVDEHSEKVVLLRNAELTKPFPKGSKVSLVQNDQPLYECVL
ncbi:fimbrial biogenesis chaperone [Vibrio chagasii]|uniref:Molecular chaperone n=1 Tax=Vibrio chagasii TaxID=170679 RepID=A0A7Y4DR16_9VIBR|nr:molecular chaperone [Vibrio chagasii]NOH32951.1 molecular chaperone [Vibrio chagasii]